MRVTVSAGSWGQRYLGGAHKVLDMPQGATALACALAAGLPADETGMLAADGVQTAPDAPLQDGQILRVYARIIGG